MESRESSTAVAEAEPAVTQPAEPTPAAPVSTERIVQSLGASGRTQDALGVMALEAQAKDPNAPSLNLWDEIKSILGLKPKT